MAITEFSAALNQVATERGIPVEAVLETINTALISAYRKDYGGDVEKLTAEINPETGEAKVFEDGKDVTPAGFGRIAAQTAKQVILQKIREKEKEIVFDEYREKLGTIVSGHIFRIDKNAILDLGRAQGILPPSQQVDAEEYQINQRLKVLIKDVSEGERGTEIIVSRLDPKFVEELFALEVPEISSGVVKIEGIAREAGSRTKLAVSSSEENVDPVGSCVGQRGVRVQNIIAELGKEKIDIIPYSEDSDKFIASSLSPAKVINVKVNEKNKKADVEVPSDQLSLAIGKEGQNVRLAAKLTGWKIDIKGGGDVAGESKDEAGKGSETKKEDKGDKLSEVAKKVKEEEKIKTAKEAKDIKVAEPVKGDMLSKVAKKVKKEDEAKAAAES